LTIQIHNVSRRHVAWVRSEWLRYRCVPKPSVSGIPMMSCRSITTKRRCAKIRGGNSAHLRPPHSPLPLAKSCPLVSPSGNYAHLKMDVLFRKGHEDYKATPWEAESFVSFACRELVERCLRGSKTSATLATRKELVPFVETCPLRGNTHVLPNNVSSSGKYACFCQKHSFLPETNSVDRAAKKWPLAEAVLTS
jgi:hypothetical protein